MIQLYVIIRPQNEIVNRFASGSIGESNNSYCIEIASKSKHISKDVMGIGWK